MYTNDRQPGDLSHYDAAGRAQDEFDDAHAYALKEIIKETRETMINGVRDCPMHSLEVRDSDDAAMPVRDALLEAVEYDPAAREFFDQMVRKSECPLVRGFLFLAAAAHIIRHADAAAESRVLS